MSRFNPYDPCDLPPQLQRCFSSCHEMLVKDKSGAVVEKVFIRQITGEGFLVVLDKHQDKPLQPLLFAETLWCSDGYYRFSINYEGKLEVSLSDGSEPEFSDDY